MEGLYKGWEVLRRKLFLRRLFVGLLGWLCCGGVDGVDGAALGTAGLVFSVVWGGVVMGL